VSPTTSSVEVAPEIKSWRGGLILLSFYKFKKMKCMPFFFNIGVITKLSYFILNNEFILKLS